MPVPIPETLGMLGDNLQKRHSVLPVSRRRASRWARDLGLPKGGRTVLYTGQMYQIVPAINAMTDRLARVEHSWMAGYFGVARRLNRWVSLASVMARGDPEEVREFSGYLANIARLLAAAGAEFGYLYEDDLYAGALAHDEGLDGILRHHAEYVVGRLQANGVRELITVDPHTTYMLRSIYPKIVRGFDLPVRTYLEILAERAPRPSRQLGVSATIHDSCLYARREGVVAQPRALLGRAGVTVRETELSGTMTQCCGGPIEMLFPARSNEVAKKRVDQLARTSDRVVTLCPLCLANLRRVAPEGMQIEDISGYLARAYFPVPSTAARPTGPIAEASAPAAAEAAAT